MAFLDNSGDIILDAVLTDAGRQRLAKGDGSFRITQFALADDEIDYSLYDKNNISGSAYYDLQILQTPIFEAFTNNIASLNSKLLSINRTNLLYLPVLKINDQEFGYAPASLVQNGYILTADDDTEAFFNENDGKIEYNGASVSFKSGIIYGFAPSDTTAGGIRIDQGIDNKNKPKSTSLDSDLMEEQYSIEMDNRISKLITISATSVKESFIDDDDMAMYYVAIDDGTSIVTPNLNTKDDNKQVIIGQRGSIVRFKLQSSLDISSSEYLFDQIGVDLSPYFTISGASLSASGIGYSKIKSILTSIRITGLTTGYSIDVPLLVLKAN